MNRGQLQRVAALASLIAAAAFSAFFFAVKHEVWLARVAPFVNDPYDAVGSFALQLAGLAGALSVLRAIRDPGSAAGRDVRAVQVLRSATVALLAIFVALLADLVGMVRHADTWLSSPTGRRLALSVALMATAAAVAAHRLARRARGGQPLRAGLGTAVSAVVALVLSLYPDGWRHTAAAAILTALFGSAVLFVGVWALASILLPQNSGDHEDLLDEACAAFEWSAGLLGKNSVLPATFQPLAGRRIATWLRTHNGRIVAILALVAGLSLAAIEAVGEGLPATAPRAALVLAVFIGIEAGGVLVGYLLFRHHLSLIRAE